MSGLRIVVTGGDGFIGRNLRQRLHELGYIAVTSVNRNTPEAELNANLGSADFVFHLAGVNRPTNDAEFAKVNGGLTAYVCRVLAATSRQIPIVFSSSIQAERNNAYGQSKRTGESEIEQYGVSTGSRAIIIRLPNVFGKWSRPNYNSGVATFCHNLANGLPIVVNDVNAPLSLVYIDDLVEAMVALLDAASMAGGYVDVAPVYVTTVGEVVDIIRSFAENRITHVVPEVGAGLKRALYATYLSYVKPENFTYGLTQHTDSRGSFVEMMKTVSCGQLSYFTAHPGITRGEHYHHTKAEKFLVVKGSACFGFRNLLTDERYDLTVTAEEARVVETVPGWVHKITNVGTDEMIVMLWASEIFNPSKPDTVAATVDA
jgi:UDP-2-acetamido-2,6-beta-L-arabino-hexul-4-ose reductase